MLSLSQCLFLFSGLKNDNTHLVNCIKVKRTVLGQIDLWVKRPDTEFASLVVLLLFFCFCFLWS